MQPLDKLLRNQLEKTVKEARDVAEAGARAALEQLGVGQAALTAIWAIPNVNCAGSFVSMADNLATSEIVKQKRRRSTG